MFTASTERHSGNVSNPFSCIASSNHESAMAASKPDTARRWALGGKERRGGALMSPALIKNVAADVAQEASVAE